MGSTNAVLTPDALLEMPRPPHGKHYELDEGELIVVGNAGMWHERVKRRIVKILMNYESMYSTGEAWPESQFTLGPATARIPDVAFVRNAKLGKLANVNQPIPIVPDLAVEVVSDSETAGLAERKVQQYLAAGVVEVWQVYPAQRRVRVRTAANARELTSVDILESATLPGFSVPVASFFE